MGHGVFRAYSFTMAAQAGSASVNLGRSFQRVYLQIPSMASTTGLDVYASPDGTQTYYQIGKEVPNTTTVQSWSFTVAASAAANGRLVQIPAGLQFYKIVASDSAPSGAQGFQVLCAD
jgi:hypothetical protein